MMLESTPETDSDACSFSSAFSNHYKFTGKERDSESGLDNFGPRYNASTMGRFMSTDPVTATPLHLINPQRWNKYAYGLNNPLSYIDPDGRDAIAVNFRKEVPGGGHQGIISVQADGSAQYARFGPVHANRPSDQGKVDVHPLSPVTFRSDGLPTDASYKQLSEQVEKSKGKVLALFGPNSSSSSSSSSIPSPSPRATPTSTSKGHAQGQSPSPSSAAS